jgi:sarcosine oxidase
MKKANIIVLGLGVMGLSVLFHLARAKATGRDITIIGLDQGDAIPNNLGSSHGHSRVTRQAIAEGAQYTPLALRSHEIWRAIEAQTNQHKRILLDNGYLIIEGSVSPDLRRDFLRNSLEVAERHPEIEHTFYPNKELRQAFRQFTVTDAATGYFEPRGGAVLVEPALKALANLAQQNGAEIFLNQRVSTYEEKDGLIYLKTGGGETYCAEQVVLAPGPYIKPFLPSKYEQAFRVCRQSVHWFKMENPERFLSKNGFPVFSYTTDDGLNFYGFPDLENRGLKIAVEQVVTDSSPSEIRRMQVTQREIDFVTHLVHTYLGEGTCIQSEICMYTMTPDLSFVIDRHPLYKNMFIVSACSGHAFKMAPAIGETVAQTLLGSRPRFDLSAFNLQRLLLPS